MSLIVTTTRPMPFPPMEISGQNVTFLPVQSTAEIPEGTKVHCATAVDPITARDIGAMPQSVRLIANFGVGVDNIDLDAATSRSILVSNTPVVTEDTADLAFTLILAASRRLGEAERFMREGHWGETAMPPLGARVHGKTLGLVGFGHIAQAVARRAQGFGMKLQYWNRSERKAAADALGARFVASLPELFANSDIVSVHTALTPETDGLVDETAFRAAKQGLVFVNTARGGIVDETALLEALARGQVGAAGLDVFVGEPKINAQFFGFENVVLTPHIGSATHACRQDMAARLLANVRSYLETGEVIDVVKVGE